MENVFGLIAGFGLLIVIILLIVTNIRIVPQAQAYVLERLGAYHETWGVGLHFKIPMVDAIAKKVSLKENVIDFPPQPVITKDNVTMEIDTVVYFQITDPKLYAYGVVKILQRLRLGISLESSNLTEHLQVESILTARSESYLMRQLMLGELKLTEWK